MAAAFEQTVGTAASATAGAAWTITVGAAGTTAGNTLVMIIHSALNTGTPVITDARGTWTLVDTVTGRDPNIATYAQSNAPAYVSGDTITARWGTGSTTGSAGSIYEFSGLSAAGPDAAIQDVVQAAATTYNTGSTTVPTGAHLLLSAVALGNSTATPTPTGSGTWTALPAPATITGFGRSARHFYQIVSGGGTLQNVGTVSASVASNKTALAFAAAVGPGVLPDTAAGVDALTVTARTPLPDTATGADAVAVTAATPLTDTAAGADQMAVANRVTLTDTAAGVDLVSTSGAPIALPDVGAAADALTVVTVRATLTDTAAATDVMLTAGALVALPDTATAGDALTVTARTPLPDTATGVDALTVVTELLTLTETAAAADTATVTVTTALADTATALDALTGVVLITLTETAAAADTVAGYRPVPLPDAAGGDDVLARVPGSITRRGVAVLAANGIVNATLTANGVGAATLHVPAQR